MRPGSSISAMMRIGPLHFGHCSGSASYTLRISRAQVALGRAAKSVNGPQSLAVPLGDQGIDAVSMTPEAFAAFIRSEAARWTEVVKTPGAKAG